MMNDSLKILIDSLVISRIDTVFVSQKDTIYVAQQSGNFDWVSISIAATMVILTIISLVYHRKNVEANIKHNKLKIKPVLDVFFESEAKETNFKLAIRNSGFGIGRIVRFYLAWDDLEFFDEKNRVNNEIYEHLKLYFGKCYVNVAGFDRACIKEGEKLVIFSIELNEDMFDKLVDDWDSHLTCLIEYEDFYGEKYKTGFNF